MKIGIIGLGLIGGSLAKAIKSHTDATVIGYDISPTTLNKALMLGAVDEAMDEKGLKECDMIFIALYPNDTIDFVKKNANNFKQDAIIVDCCGVKEAVCEPLHDFCYSKKMWFIGGHPMAGREYSGFEYAKTDLFANASMILTPFTYIPLEIVEETKNFCLGLGFKQVVLTTPQKHDQMIAYTSQLMHVVAATLCDNEILDRAEGFSAGSLRDCTRVAKLNPKMWAELFVENREALSEQIKIFTDSLNRIESMIHNSDTKGIEEFLTNTCERKKRYLAEKEKRY